MKMETLLLFVLVLPIAGTLFLTFAGKMIPKYAGWIGFAAAAFSFLCAIKPALASFNGIETHLLLWKFFETDSLSVDVSFQVDKLSGIMLFVVLGVGSLIHLYSIEYMKHDPSIVRFFAYLNAFIGCMLILILGDNLLMMFVGWEGVGFASYALIGFWYEKDAPARAGIKAFITNRVGDFGFIFGIMLLIWITGSAKFSDIAVKASELSQTYVNIGGITFKYFELAAFALFLGACGKSAQFPLHLWLPDAMEGPTPVSALIHAATMVTAGVYMVVRMEPVFANAPVVRDYMLIIACITAVGASIAACAQTDLKRILAYSTISQLGYMMAGAAVLAKGAAIFHLATHSVFKGLLFLSAGSIMHALSGKLDIREMGGLLKRLPVTSTALIIGTLGLVGVPFFAGYYSKDLIIESIAGYCPISAYILVFGVMVTAFYSARMIMLSLFGNERVDQETSKHCHESGKIILIPLIILSIGTLIVGHISIPQLLQPMAVQMNANESADYELNSNADKSADIDAELHHSNIIYFAIASLFIGLFAGIFYYRTHQSRSSPLKEFIRGGFGWDALVEKILIRPCLELADWTRKHLDGSGIDSLAIGLAQTIGAIGETMRTIQTGNIGTYLGYAVIGLSVLLWFVVP